MKGLQCIKLIAGIGLLSAFTSTVSAAPDYVRAWAWANNANVGVNDTYTALSNWSQSSGFRRTSTRPFRVHYSGDVSITRTSTGNYRVLFQQMTSTGGTVHVTAYGGNHRCKVSSWGKTSAGQNVYVKCHSPSGSSVNGKFAVMYYKDGPKGDYYSDAYLWANNPTSSSYTPSTAYQANSTDQLNTITRNSQGNYQVRLPGMNISSSDNIGGSIMVTAYGTNSDYCKVNNWYSWSQDAYANVSCYNSSGSPTDSRFTLSYMKGITQGISVAEDQWVGAYVWANTATYPLSFYQYNYSGKPIERHDISTGNYRVEIPGLRPYYNVSTHVKVTAYGSTPNYCNIVNWGNSSSHSDGIRANVKCYNANGDLSNTSFALQYFTNENILY